MIFGYRNVTAGESLQWIKDSLLMMFRVVAITLGGYGLTSALCALTGMLLYAVGVSLREAMLTTVMFGYLVYIAVIMWGFVDRTNFRRPWAILAAAAVSMLLTSVLAPSVLAQ